MQLVGFPFSPTNENPCLHPQSSANSEKCFQGRRMLIEFDKADIIPRHFCTKAEFFL